MKIKSALRFPLTPVTMAIFKGNYNKCCKGCGKTRTLILLVGMQISTISLERSIKIPHKAR
jgi:hypothetical protein